MLLHPSTILLAGRIAIGTINMIFQTVVAFQKGFHFFHSLSNLFLSVHFTPCK